MPNKCKHPGCKFFGAAATGLCKRHGPGAATPPTGKTSDGAAGVAGLRVAWSPANVAYVAMFNGTPTAINGRNFWRTKAQLDDDLRQSGLRVTATGLVKPVGVNPWAPREQAPPARATHTPAPRKAPARKANPAEPAAEPKTPKKRKAPVTLAAANKQLFKAYGEHGPWIETSLFNPNGYVCVWKGRLVVPTRANPGASTFANVAQALAACHLAVKTWRASGGK